MGGLFTKNVALNSDIDRHEAILFDWVTAAFNLHQNYTNLVSFFQSNQPDAADSRKQKQYVGQCPSDQFLVLITRMEVELQKLIQDLDSVNKFDSPAATGNYNKLAAHTQILNKLNQEAQTRLLLATCPTT
ncbi:hypothetical protein [Spirosoma aerophilum]